MPERDEALYDRLMADTDSDWPDRLLSALAKAPVVVDESVADFANDYQMATKVSLSDRELQVLHCASLGLDHDHIADLLFVSIETVKQHLKAARYVLRAKNTTHACCLALRHGLFE